MAENDQDVEAIALARALEATSRSAVSSKEEIGSPLLDPKLAALAHEALSASLGSAYTSTDAFPLTLWRHGAEHVGKTSPGTHFTGTVQNFLEILQARGQLVLPKRTGWVVEPTTNPQGLRTNEATLAMHAVLLDCDGRGSWDKATTRLQKIGLAHLGYQSSSHTPAKPKWRLAIPLSAPFAVRDDLQRIAWKRTYHRIRVLVGALGELTHEGFDPRTDSPATPWFCTEKPTPESLPREAFFVPGKSLDLTALAFALPVVDCDAPAAPKRQPRAPRGASSDKPRELGDADLDLLVSSLATVTNAIPRGRRDLYLALPGALLDRGLCPDDVLQVCTEVSASYPRKHDDKHKDNVHNAKTTIARGKEAYTRIGTLQAQFPDVAAVLDRLLPDLVNEALLASMAEGAAMHESVRVSLPDLSNNPVPTQPAPTIESKTKKARISLRKRLTLLGEEKEKSENKKQSTAGQALLNVLKMTFQVAFRDVRVQEDAAKEIFEIVGFGLGVATDIHKNVSFDEVLVALKMSSTSTEVYQAGAASYAVGMSSRIKWDAAAPARFKKKLAEKIAYDRQGI